MRRTLALTSPEMHGDDVKYAQRLLSNHGYYQGEVDGHFGMLTGQACHRAKYWQGYAAKNLEQTFGNSLERLLVDPPLAKPTVAMKARIASRKRAQPKEKPLRELALAQARGRLGLKEVPPGSNNVPGVTDWYGINGPWCAMFVTRCYVAAGSKAFVRRSRYSYVPFLLGEARMGLNHLTVTKKPQPGDLVCFDWEGNGVYDHIGLFVGWADNNHFETIEGNTSNVSRREVRATRTPHVFVHVGR